MTTFKYYQQVIPPGSFAVVFEHEINSDPDRSLITFAWDEGGETTNQSTVDAVAAAWGAEVVDPLMSTNTALVRTTVSDAGGVIYENEDVVPGTVVGPFGPVSNSVLVEKRSASSGRRNRGRIYLPIVRDADVDENGRIDLPRRTAAIAAVQAFHDACLAVTGVDTMVILHSKGWGTINTNDPRDPVPADPGNAPPPTIITHYTSRPIMGTQRRRVR